MTTMTESVGSATALRWEEAYEAGAETCGGKGYHLGWLNRYGFRIPSGGVVPARWYAELVKAVSPRAMSLVREAQAEDVMNAEVISALEEICKSLETAEFPTEFGEALADFLEYEGLDQAFVAVRSSATAEDGARASFAGIHQS